MDAQASGRQRSTAGVIPAQEISIFILRWGFIEPEIDWVLGWPAWPPSPRNPTASTSPMLGRLECASKLKFYLGAGIELRSLVLTEGYFANWPTTAALLSRPSVSWLSEGRAPSPALPSRPLVPCKPDPYCTGILLSWHSSQLNFYVLFWGFLLVINVYNHIMGRAGGNTLAGIKTQRYCVQCRQLDITQEG